MATQDVRRRHTLQLFLRFLCTPSPRPFPSCSLSLSLSLSLLNTPTSSKIQKTRGMGGASPRCYDSKHNRLAGGARFSLAEKLGVTVLVVGSARDGWRSTALIARAVSPRACFPILTRSTLLVRPAMSFSVSGRVLSGAVS